VSITAGWGTAAACKDEPVKVFFPEGIGRGLYDSARVICARCPVAQECLDAAMAAEGYGTKVRHGMYGGLNPKERYALRAPLVCEVCEREFHAKRARAWCSEPCRKIRDARYMRDYQRSQRNNGRPNPIAQHGSITMAKSGCTCPACRGRRRTARRVTRMNALQREVA
jgi:hypothetical protein